MQNLKEILDKALTGTLLLRGSQTKLEKLRFLLYAIRKKDRREARTVHGPDAVSRYDSLRLGLSFNLEEMQWELKIERHEDFLKDLSILHEGPGGNVNGL